MNVRHGYGLSPSSYEEVWNMEFVKPTESDAFLTFTFIITFSDRTQSEFTTKAVKIIN